MTIPKSPEERKATLERQIAAKKQLIRRIDKRETEKARRLRNHRLIVAGALTEGIIAAEPGSPITTASDAVRQIKPEFWRMTEWLMEPAWVQKHSDGKRLLPAPHDPRKSRRLRRIER